ncbi:MAG: helix-turn-helix transcriptional regulator [Anaerolineae bacterium]
MTNDNAFGKALQQFRKRAGIGIFDLTVLMGWKGTGPIIELEKGKRLPRLSTIDRLGEALKLTHSDICYLRGLAGYGPYTKMPTKAQIITVLEAVVEMMKGHPYPTYVTDFRSTYWLFNPAESALMEMSMDALRDLMTRVTSIFDVVFDSRLGLSERMLNREAAESDQVFRFKAYNQYRRHEPFYLEYPECFASRLNADDYARLKKAWHSVDVTLDNHKLVYPFGSFKRPNGDVQIKLAEGGSFRFDRIEQPILHLNGLFDLVYYRPTGTPEEQQRCQEYFAQFTWQDQQFIKLWDLVDVEQILLLYDGHPTEQDITLED